MSGARDQRREALIIEHQQLARALARRYANRGEPVDDLEQVAMIGLIKAVDRFDTGKGADFHAFATPTIVGEIRRHFRDKTWPIHVPRGLKDDHFAVSSATTALTNRLGRSPTISELAAEASLTDDRVLDALAAHSAYRPNSLSQSPGADEDDTDVEIPVEEIGYHIAEGRTAVHEGLARLPARERLILHLRFDQGMIQSDIAKIVGVSQMHVSRLIARALETVRRIADEGDL
jgi:RNA polymerase sigma-B factor